MPLHRGTDTLSYTASAVSLMLAGFRKPIIITGSQLPLDMPRSDARQNLIDSITCATVGLLYSIHVGTRNSFDPWLLKGNMVSKC